MSLLVTFGGLHDFSNTSMSTIQFLTVDVRREIESPKKLKAWMQSQFQTEVFVTSNSETQALETLISKYSSLGNVLSHLESLEKEADRASRRSIRYEMNPLLKRYDLKQMSEDHTEILVDAIQSELAACYSYNEKCNLLSHPLLQETQNEVFSPIAVKSNLHEMFQLSLLKRDSRRNLDIKRDCVKVSKIQFIDEKSHVEEIGEIVRKCKEDMGHMKLIEFKNDSPSKSHPAAWTSNNSKIMIAENSTLLLESRIRDIMNVLTQKVDKLQDEVLKQQEVIDVQRNIEMQLIKSKREIGAVNFQLASIVLRMIHHVYPSLWKRLSALSFNDSIPESEFLKWEVENNSWLKEWIEYISPQQTSQQVIHRNQPQIVKQVIPTKAASGSTNEIVTRKKQHAVLLDSETEYFVSRLVSSILPSIKSFASHSSEFNQGIWMDAVVLFSYDVNIIPELLSDKQVAFLFGIACTTAKSADEGINTIQVLQLWVMECAKRSFKKHFEYDIDCVKAFANHLRNRMTQKKCQLSPSRPSSKSSNTCTSIYGQHKRITIPKVLITQDTSLYGVFVFYAKSHVEKTSATFDEISQSNESINSAELLRFLNDYMIIPDLINRKSVFEILASFPKRMGYRQFTSFLKYLSASPSPAKLLLIKPYITLFNEKQNDFEPDPEKVLHTLIDCLTERIHGHGIKNVGAHELSIKTRLLRQAQLAQPKTRRLEETTLKNLHVHIEEELNLLRRKH